MTPSGAPGAPIRVKGLDHVTLVVSDLERSRAFYTGVLGMEQIERPAFPFPGLWFESDRTQVHLILAGDGCSPPGAGIDPSTLAEGLAHHFAFEVDDAYAAAEALRERDVPIMGGPTRRPDGCIQVWFYDPDGHVVEVFHRPR